MKRKIITLFVAIMMLFTLNSCDVYTYATTQDDIYVETEVDVVHSTVDYNIVLRLGTPYYYNGSLLYYLYNRFYYYPFYYDNYWYLRAYRRPFNHLYYRPYFRPHRYDYRFDKGFRPHNNWYKPQNYHNYYNRPTPQPHRGDNHFRSNPTRPTQPIRPNTHITHPSNRGNSGGSFRGSIGGRR